jgi:hypothetical protein
MTEFRRLKMKIGEAEFEADVPESEVQPMYHQFLSMLERRSRSPAASLGSVINGVDLHPEGAIHTRKTETAARPVFPVGPRTETFDRSVLTRIFALRDDGAVTLKVLPKGGDTNAHAVLLLLYGYYRLKNEEYVLVTQLFRAAEQSGIPVRRPVSRYVRNSSLVVRGGQRKGSHFSLSRQGIVMAEEITAKLIG